MRHRHHRRVAQLDLEHAVQRGHLRFKASARLFNKRVVSSSSPQTTLEDVQSTI